MLSESASLEEIQDAFSADKFATEACGAYILDAREGYAKCAFDITAIHRNAASEVMGGALFTLADFALAVACNIGEQPTVSISNTIQFMSASKGSRLFAECEVEKSGRSLGFYNVRVTDDHNKLIAIMTATCYRQPAQF